MPCSFWCLTEVSLLLVLLFYYVTFASLKSFSRLDFDQIGPMGTMTWHFDLSFQNAWPEMN